jgi:lipoic acid synthetase
MTSKLPSWFKQDIPGSKTLELARLFSDSGINTVCQKAKCPNITDCFRDKRATFMILGDVCTRNCRFCNLNKSGTVLKPKQKCPLKRGTLRLSQEPSRIAGIVKKLGLNYVVITSVTRDDLTDGGAAVFAKTIELIRGLNNKTKVEVLIPDFCGKILSLEKVLNAGPHILSHNMETVERLYQDIRPMANYQLSLTILSRAKELKPQIHTKSSMMLGLGETEPEVIKAMKDLREHRCDILTLGQYLAPSFNHYPVKEFISIEQFNKHRDIGLGLGFKAVLSGPKVRSSYHAQDLHRESAYV